MKTKTLPLVESFKMNFPISLNATVSTINDTQRRLSAGHKNNMNASNTYEEILTESTVIIFYVLYILVFLFGISGNLVTLAVIIQEKSMRRSIHFYTLNLVSCDMLILLFYVPTQLEFIIKQMNWTMGLTMCKVNYFILPIALVGTIGTLLAITIDRARGLLQPFKWRSDSTRNAKISIPIIWIVSLILNIPLFIVPKVQTIEGMVSCTEEWPGTDNYYYYVYWTGMFILTFLVPLIIIFVIHVIMVQRVRKETCVIYRTHVKQMMHLTIAVVVVFTICTGCQHFFFILSLKTNFEVTTLAVLFCASNFMVTMQAAVNPVIYGTLRKDLKKAFKSILWKITTKLGLPSSCTASLEKAPYEPSYSTLTPIGHEHENKETENCLKESNFCLFDQHDMEQNYTYVRKCSCDVVDETVDRRDLSSRIYIKKITLKAFLESKETDL